MNSSNTSAAFSSESGWRQAFHLSVANHPYQNLRVDGNIPFDLQGTLYRNGPGDFEPFGQRVGHWFDPEGLISGVRIQKGSAMGALNTIHTEANEKERSAGKPLYRTFSRQGAGFRRFGTSSGKNPGNTSVLWWQNQLFALNEGGWPILINPNDLSTVKETDLEGMVIQGFSAHPHANASSDTIYNIGLTYGRETKVSLFALPAIGKPSTLATIPIPFATLIHDFIVTQNYAVLFISPVVIGLSKYLIGMGSLYDNLSWDPQQGTEVIVISLHEPDSVIRFSTEAFFQWHFANAYEQGKDELVIDFVRYPDMNTYHGFSCLVRDSVGDGFDGTYHRARIHLVEKRMRTEKLWDGICEFPKVSPLSEGVFHKYAYMANHSDLATAKHSVQNQLTKFNVETCCAEPFFLGQDQFPSEPIFVPKVSRVKEDDGYLLSLVFDGKTKESFVGIWDAQTPSAPMLAKIYWDQPLPFTFHGVFVPEVG